MPSYQARVGGNVPALVCVLGTSLALHGVRDMTLFSFLCLHAYAGSLNQCALCMCVTEHLRQGLVLVLVPVLVLARSMQANCPASCARSPERTI